MKATILDHFKRPLWSKEARDKRFIVLNGGAGSGKCLAPDTKVLTPTDEVCIRDIEIGDVVLDSLGTSCKVLNKWTNYRPMYEIALEDGRKVTASDNHTWTYYRNGHKLDGTTSDMYSDLSEGIEVGIPLTVPVRFDNCTYAVPTILALIVTGADIDPDATFKPEMRNAGLLRSNGKLIQHIPKSYLHMSLFDRLSFLNALFERKGEWDRENRILRLVLKSDSDAKIVQSIIWSCGGICTRRRSSRYGGSVLEFRFGDDLYNQIMFEKCSGNAVPDDLNILSTPYVRVESIKYLNTSQCYCIEVDSPNHLYLVNDYIVTHNSEAICQRIAYMFLTQEDMVFAVVRATMPALTRSVYLGDPSIIHTLSEWGVPTERWLNKTEATLRNPENGSVMYFIGLDDPEKIKSMNLNYIFIEEATEINADKWAQLNSRLRRHNKYGKNQMFLAYNPISWYNWVVQMFIANPDPLIKDDTIVHFSNFSQNPYVSIDNVKSMFARAAQDETYYRTYVIGKPGKPLGLIYTNIVFTPHSTWPDEVWAQKPYYGIDWGYIDPMVLMECRNYDKKIYVRCLFYKTKTNTKDFLDYMENTLKISKLSNIYYDSADAERGSLLLQRGFTAFKAKKNIVAGISYVKGFEIIADSEGEFAQDFMDEAQAYTWQTDPDDSSKFIEEPIETNNHGMDAMRYAITTENMIQRQITAAALDMSVDETLRKSGIYFGDDST